MPLTVPFPSPSWDLLTATHPFTNPCNHPSAQANVKPEVPLPLPANNMPATTEQAWHRHLPVSSPPQPTALYAEPQADINRTHSDDAESLCMDKSDTLSSSSLNPIQLYGCVSPSEKHKPIHCSHGRKAAPNHVKRPCNAFILFRSHAVATSLVPKEVERDHRNISRIISHMWRSLDPEERKQWENQAELEKERHRRAHPDYKYKPSSRRAHIPRRNIRRRSSTERQCEQIADIILKSYGRSGVKQHCANACIRSATGHAIAESERGRDMTKACHVMPRRSLSSDSAMAILNHTPWEMDPCLWPPNSPSLCVPSCIPSMPRRSLSAPPIQRGIVEMRDAINSNDMGLDWLLETPLLAPTTSALDASSVLHSSPAMMLESPEHGTSITYSLSPVPDEHEHSCAEPFLDAFSLEHTECAQMIPAHLHSVSPKTHAPHEPWAVEGEIQIPMAILPLVSALGLAPYPADDPFYYPGNGWQNAKPGQILKQRKIQAASVGLLHLNVLDAYQMLYRSNSNTAHTPSYSVTTVLVPHGAKKDHMVVISSPENANAGKCAPSYAFRYTGVLELTNFEPRWEQMIYTLFLEEGWVVNAPDHEGPASAFAAGRLGGHLLLDSIRATLNHKGIGMAKNAMIIGHGYSGGSIPTGWAASLMPHYAPELNIVGWSLGGTASDPGMTLQYLDGQATAALVLCGAVGLIDGYHDELYDLFDQQIWTDTAKRAVDIAHNACIYEMVFRFIGEKIQSPKYIKGGHNLSSFPQVQSILNSLILGRDPKFVPKQPVNMFHAAYDEEIVWYQANNTAVNWCNQGANIRFLTETSRDLNHVSTYLLNVPYIIQYMRDRFLGKDFYGGGCQFDTLESDPLFDVSILGERFREALQAILDLLGKEIGPGDSIINGKIRNKQNPNREGLVHIKGLDSRVVSPGEGGNDTPASKAVRKTNQPSDHDQDVGNTNQQKSSIPQTNDTANAAKNAFHGTGNKKSRKNSQHSAAHGAAKSSSS
ncbi:hypothetical protein MVES1_002313 [Malassezia vespertilionis]|uniref:uncharacterized protein n=1 Tax=Malassezia vespertilionis TaxID=2020962 RepID=UPI0024B21D75|nr:uncharacterized protein MVES1_002313 [Malassezia vespertilionis]WFD06958.1 hypothetical protein MVES1_002313 [Malassezia vespertilionis]